MIRLFGDLHLELDQLDDSLGLLMAPIDITRRLQRTHIGGVRTKRLLVVTDGLLVPLELVEYRAEFEQQRALVGACLDHREKGCQKRVKTRPVLLSTEGHTTRIQHLG